MRATEMDLQGLAGVPALAGCSRAELEAVDSRATELRLRAGRAICHQGARAREVVILLEGFATVSTTGQLVRQVGPGTVLGAVELVGAGAHSATVITKSVARVLVLGALELADLQCTAPAVAARLVDGRAPVPSHPSTRRVERGLRVPAIALRPA